MIATSVAIILCVQIKYYTQCTYATNSGGFRQSVDDSSVAVPPQCLENGDDGGELIRRVDHAKAALHRVLSGSDWPHPTDLKLNRIPDDYSRVKQFYQANMDETDAKK